MVLEGVSLWVWVWDVMEVWVEKRLSCGGNLFKLLMPRTQRITACMSITTSSNTLASQEMGLLQSDDPVRGRCIHS